MSLRLDIPPDLISAIDDARPPLEQHLLDAQRNNAKDHETLAWCEAEQPKRIAIADQRRRELAAAKDALAEVERAIDARLSSPEVVRVSFFSSIVTRKVEDDAELVALRAKLPQLQSDIDVKKTLLREAQSNLLYSYRKEVLQRMRDRAVCVEGGPVFGAIVTVYSGLLRCAITKALQPFNEAPTAGQAENTDAFRFLQVVRTFGNILATEENLTLAIAILNRARRGQPHLGFDAPDAAEPSPTPQTLEPVSI